MFQNLENWVIAINPSDDIDELKQLYNIWRDVYCVKMNDYYDYFSTLRYHINTLENKLIKSNPTLNGDNLDLDHSSIPLSGFDDARNEFNNDQELKRYLIEHILVLHDEIDKLADIIPKMLNYWKQLKAERLASASEVDHVPITTHKGMITYYSDTIYNNWITTPTGQKIYQSSYPDPILTLYHIDGNLPIDEDAYEYINEYGEY